MAKAKTKKKIEEWHTKAGFCPFWRIKTLKGVDEKHPTIAVKCLINKKERSIYGGKCVHVDASSTEGIQNYNDCTLYLKDLKRKEAGQESYFRDKAFIGRWLAKDICAKHRFLTHEKSHIIYAYSDGVYSDNGSEVVQAESIRLLGDFSKRNRINEALAYIMYSTYTAPDKFEAPIDLINVKNGILNLETNELIPHTPDIIFLNRIPVDYDPKADCPVIKKFLKEVLQPDDIPLFQEYFGFCLLREYRFARALMLLGPGENGKTSTLSLLEAFLGTENIATPSLQDVVSSRFSQYELYGRLANIHDDIPSSKLSYTGRFKMLTGGGLVRGEKKHKDGFNFKNYAKLIYSANELPVVEDSSLAFWRRWFVLKFDNSFPEGGKNTDPNLQKKLTTPEELSGFLNWGLVGLRRLLENKKFTTTKSTQETKREWVMQTDSLRAFVMNCVKLNPEVSITKNDFFEAYKLFCVEYEITPLDKANLGRKLPTITPQVRDYIPTIDGKRQRAWKGIELFFDESTENGKEFSKKIKEYNNKVEKDGGSHEEKDIWNGYRKKVCSTPQNTEERG